MAKVAKVVEIIAEGKSIDDAVENGVKEASKSIRNIRSVFVESFQALVEDDKVTKYRINAKVTFIVD